MTIKQKSYLYAFFALVEFVGGVYELIKDQYVIGVAFIVVAVAFTIKSVELRLENRKSNQDS
jgi:hypothetical protein